jgi:hypothetical protein
MVGAMIIQGIQLLGLSDDGNATTNYSGHEYIRNGLA